MWCTLIEINLIFFYSHKKRVKSCADVKREKIKLKSKDRDSILKLIGLK